MNNITLQNSYGIPCGVCLPQNGTGIAGIRRTWRLLNDKIRRRLGEFDHLRQYGSEEQFFAELAFCLFTPQSGALRCWAAVRRLHERGLLFGGTAERIAAELAGVRFHHTKARRLVMARRQFTRDGRLCLRGAVTRSGRTVSDTRDWLVQNVVGFGYKEASHFLRNVGYYRDVAILDRHILRNLQALDVIDTIPDALPRNTYCTIERKMKRLVLDTGIPASHLDLVFWCRATGEIFK